MALTPVPSAFAEQKKFTPNGAPTPSSPPDISQILERSLPTKGISRSDRAECPSINALTQTEDTTGAAKETHSVTRFLKPFDIDPWILKTEDIEAIYDLMREYPMARGVSLFALFGLKNMELLQKLESTKKDEFLHTWQGNYLMAACAFQCNCCSPPLKSGRGEITQSIGDVKAQIKEYENLLAGLEDLKNQRNQRLYTYHSTHTKPLVEQLIANQKLLLKFMMHPESQDLLWHVTLRSCAGYGDILPFKTDKEMNKAGTLLVQYVWLIHGGVQRFPPQVMGSDIQPLLHTLSSKLRELRFDGSQNRQQLMQKCWSLTQWVAEQAEKLESDALEQRLALPGYDQKVKAREMSAREAGFKMQQFLMTTLYAKWMWNVFDTLDNSILKVADPSYQLARNLEARLCLHLSGLNVRLEQWAIRSLTTESPLDSEVTPSTICERFCQNISPLFEDIKAIEQEIGRLRTEEHRAALLFVASELRDLMPEFKQHTRQALAELTEYARSNPQGLQRQKLIESTAVLAEAFLAEHDADVLLHGHSPWTYPLPDEYLAFLALGEEGQNTAILAAAPEEGLAPPPAVEAPATIHYAEPELSPPSREIKEAPEDTSPAPILSIKKSKNRKKKEIANSATTSTQTTSPAVTQKAPAVQKIATSADITKQRILLQVLANLGCSTEEGGSHTRVLLHGALITTVPRHKEIKKGTARDIVAKVGAALENKSTR